MTSDSPRLDGREVASTVAATSVSASLYARLGAPYLARGVLGDLIGFAVLAGPLALRQRRLRHEALVCLGSIGVVVAARPRWPLNGSPALWLGGVRGRAGRLPPPSSRPAAAGTGLVGCAADTLGVTMSFHPALKECVMKCLDGPVAWWPGQR